MAAFEFIKQLFLTIMILVSMITAPQSGTAYEAKNPENVKFVFNAVSDAHVETNNSASYTNLQNVLYGIKGNKSADATVFLGDNTMNAQEFENMLFFSAVNATVDSENTFVMLGNHDIGNGEGDYSKLFNRFKRYNNLMLENKISKPYYSKDINGCTMIFIASEQNIANTFVMSDEQLEWFKVTVEKAGESGNPIFIFSHHPLMYIENENTNLLFDICKPYDNVFALHGHTHWAYDVYEYEGITCVNLPRVTEPVDYEPGTGVVVEVYEDEVLLRQRNFCGGEWLSETAVPLA